LQYVAAHAGFPERSEEVRVIFDSDLAVTFGGSLHFHRRVVPYELAEALAGDWINAGRSRFRSLDERFRRNRYHG
jgi:hypothetical protein